MYGFNKSDMEIGKIEHLKLFKQNKNHSYHRSVTWNFEVRGQELSGKEVWDMTCNLLKQIGLDILNCLWFIDFILAPKVRSKTKLDPGGQS